MDKNADIEPRWSDWSRDVPWPGPCGAERGNIHKQENKNESKSKVCQEGPPAGSWELLTDLRKTFVCFQ